MDLAVTLLYVPGDRRDRLAKALGLGADVVIVDLEDAVAATAKDQAREGLPELLRDGPDVRVQVRVNALDTPWAADDLAMVRELPSDVEVRLPKVAMPDDVDRVNELVDPGRRLHCLLESAVGLEHAYDIGRRSDTVASISLGEADLRSELGVDDHGLDWARDRLVVAARAAGLPPPVQSVYPNVTDLDGLAESCRHWCTRGFVGRCAIHPKQLPVIRAAYRPEPERVRDAEELLAAYATAESAGDAVTVLADGSFVDPAMLAGARRVIELEALTRT